MAAFPPDTPMDIIENQKRINNIARYSSIPDECPNKDCPICYENNKTPWSVGIMFGLTFFAGVLFSMFARNPFL